MTVTNTLAHKTSVAEVSYWLRWSATKILSRDAMYVPRRVAYTLRRRFVDASFPLFGSAGELREELRTLTAAELLAYFRSRRYPRFHFDQELLPTFNKVIAPEVRETTLKDANRILKHEFRFRGYDSVTMEQIRWDYSPDEYHGWRWDLNRHFTFTTLGLAYACTNDAIYESAFEELASSWINTLSSKLGRIPWDHPFEVAARLNGWVWAYFLFLHSPRLNNDFHQRYLRALGRLSEYLYGVLEFHNPGNHIMLEAKALATVAMLFPEFAASARWSKRAWHILSSELPEQILSDGVHAELSTMYHKICAGELAELLLLCDVNRLTTPALKEAVANMASFEWWITMPDGTFPLFGDAYLYDTYYRFSAPAIIRALNSDSALLPSTFCDPQTALATLRLPVRTGTNRPFMRRRSRAFRDSGYFVSRAPDGTLLVWDCGPVGYRANRNHSHLDALSFFFALKGKPLFIDPGTNETSARRALLRGTSSHNTAVVDGQDQSILARRNAVWRPAGGELRYFASCDECDIMAGFHRGYERLPDPLRHERTIVFMVGKYVLVFDHFTGRGHHCVEQRFHLAPHATVRTCFHGAQISVGGLSTNLVSVQGPSGPAAVRLDEVVAEMTCGAPQRSAALGFSVTACVPLSMAAIFSAFDDQGMEVTAAWQSTGDSAECVRVVGPEIDDEVYIRPQGTGQAPFARTDAHVLILSRRSGRAIFFAAGGSYLELPGAAPLKAVRDDEVYVTDISARDTWVKQRVSL